MIPETGPKTPAPSATTPAAADLEQVDAALDEALDESFPASDPVAIHVDTGDLPPESPSGSKAGR